MFLRHYATSIAVGTLLGCLLIAAAAGPRLPRHAQLLLSPAATSAPAPAIPATTPQKKQQATLIGGLDTPAQESIVGRELAFSGWAFDPAGIRAVEIRFPDHTYTATLGVPRNDVQQALPQHQGIERSGFETRIALPENFYPLDRQPIEVVAISNSGNSISLGKRSWLPDFPKQPLSGSAPRTFYSLMMTSGLHLGGGAEIETVYRDYQSSYIKTGVSVPILYMRTTTGPENDWVFDSAFDLTRRCSDRLVVEDNLESVIAFSIEKKVPAQFILNGGIWGDASCTVSPWDLTDHLEEDPMLCQWSQDNSIYPDNYLSNLPGSTASPRLARSLTYHAYATKVRDYKKRNLQAAARRLARFAKEHPDLFVGIALDADTYMNPFFDRRATFDYNPGMLRQFREWLQGTGPYADKRTSPSVPDLSAYRRAHPLTLDEVNAIAQQHWKRWEDVDPPRPSPEVLMSNDAGLVDAQVWENRWWQQWDAFRKHIVHLHYTELAQWASEAGIPQDRIFTAQGFAAKGLTFPSVLIEEKGPFNRYDSAGVSIQGSKPLNRAHLGAVTYSKPARNEVAMQQGHSLFAEFARIDDGWGVVEYNAADIDDSKTPPQYKNAYRTYRDLYNFDAQEISHMAWNGSNGLFADDPGYVSYTSFRNTGTEEAMRDFMVSHAFFPDSVRLWTFGSSHHASDDQWQASVGQLQAQRGAITLSAASRSDHNVIELLSPKDQVLRVPRLHTLTLIVPEAQRASISKLTVAAQQTSTSDWVTLAEITPQAVPFSAGFVRIDVPLHWPTDWISKNVIAEQLRLGFELASPATTLTLHRLALNSALR